MLRTSAWAVLCAAWALCGLILRVRKLIRTKSRSRWWCHSRRAGPTDGMARIISDRLGKVLGQTIVIENRGGAGGGVGGKFVAEANPDGYTILMSPGGALTTGPIVNPHIGYDPAKVFASVCELIETPLIISVRPDLPAKTLSRSRDLRQSQSGQAQMGLAGFRHRAASARRDVPARGGHQHAARAISRYRPTAQRHSGRRVRLSPIPAPPACLTSRPTNCGRSRSLAKIASRNCRTCRLRRGRLPQSHIAILARGGGASRNTARHHRQAQQCISSSARRSGDPRAARRRSAPRSRSARLRILKDVQRGTGAVDARGTEGPHQNGMTVRAM